MNRYRPPPAILRVSRQNQLRHGYMSPSRFRVLAAILTHQGPITMREILRKTGRAGLFGLYAILDALEDDGFIAREKNKGRTIRATCRAYLPGKVPQKGQ